MTMGTSQADEEKLPVEMISLLTYPFKNCSQILKKEVADEFIGSVKKAVLDRFF